MPETDLFEIMYSAGSVRRLRPDPVPDDVITKILDAAIRAPSGSNAQSWLFIVVKDAETRRQDLIGVNSGAAPFCEMRTSVSTP